MKLLESLIVRFCEIMKFLIFFFVKTHKTTGPLQRGGKLFLFLGRGLRRPESTECACYASGISSEGQVFVASLDFVKFMFYQQELQGTLDVFGDFS